MRLAGRPSTRSVLAAVRWSLLGIGIAAGVVLVVLSPFALGALAGRRTDWESLSWIGSTYGGISAVISALALVGVAGSLLVQLYQTRLQRVHAVRERHAELIRLSMENPRYDACWGATASGAAPNLEPDLLSFSNMLMNHWKMTWEIGRITETDLRYNAAKMFRGEIGRRFWGPRAALRLENARNRRERRFVRIVDEEYRRAVEAGPPVAGLPTQPPAYAADERPAATASASRTASASLAGGMAGLAAGAFVAAVLFRRTRR